MQTLAIVGASLAGLSAARAARAQGFTGQLVIIGDEPHRPYDRPPLSKDFLLGTVTADDLFLEADADELGAEWVLGSAAASLDAASRTIRLKDGRTVQADGIVISTGASARKLPTLAGLSNVFTLRTLADAQSLAPELVPGSRMAVIGAGFIGARWPQLRLRGAWRSPWSTPSPYRSPHSWARRWAVWWPDSTRPMGWSSFPPPL
ncbi:benzene 1,2-dioxygenase system ferredoxin--NAD(+) reductase subunit [Arthrobacter sp. Hiyo6]|nr:benzene 1,2-dioxygenase system ferredoxin--NAD(+) reductase subunit [Arthrobacter sp. Hiyo6]